MERRDVNMTGRDLVLVLAIFLVDNAVLIINTIRNMYKIYKNNRPRSQG